MPGRERGDGVSGWSKTSVPFKSEIESGFKWVLRACTLSPHFVSTLCRLRFVSTPCPYALSKAKDKATGGRLAFRPRPRPRAPELPVLPVVEQASACPRTCGRADARPSVRCGLGAKFGAPRAASPTSPHLCWRSRGNSHQCGADIPVCAGRQECLPHTTTLHRCG
jgi:hypothetical protein